MEPVAGSSKKNPKISYVCSKKGKPLLIYEERQYRKFKTYKTTETVLWRCVRRPCSGYITIDDKEDIIKIKEHTCGPPISSSDFEIKKAISELQEEVTGTDAPVPTLYKRKVKTILDKGLNFAGICPDLKNIKSGLYKKRNKSFGVSRLCAKTPGDVQVPKQYLDFLLADYDDGKSRILLFSLKKCREELAKTHHLYCDGTFKSAPKPFRQIYSIHGDVDGIVKPLAYAMLLDKKMSTYKNLFRLLKSSVPQMDPRFFTSDFEEAAVRAILSVFPNIIAKGCYFHFKKALKKKSKELGLNKNSVYRKHVDLCSILPHLPPECLDEAWLYIMSESPHDKNITSFNDYMVTQWIEHSFWSNKWSCYGQTHKTNNHPETHYSAINKAINKNSSKNLAKILRVLQENSINYVEIRKKMDKSESQKDAEYRNKLTNYIIEEYKSGCISLGHCMEKLRF